MSVVLTVLPGVQLLMGWMPPEKARESLAGLLLGLRALGTEFLLLTITTLECKLFQRSVPKPRAMFRPLPLGSNGLWAFQLSAGTSW